METQSGFQNFSVLSNSHQRWTTADGSTSNERNNLWIFLILIEISEL